MPVRKVAIFVEGPTELAFVERLLGEMAGYSEIAIQCCTWRAHRLVEIRGESVPRPDDKFFFLLINCQGDGAVKSAINERVRGLEEAGYSEIIGLRDLYPLDLTDEESVVAKLDQGIVATRLPIRIHLAVAEIEAWFIQETTHFARVSPVLTHDAIRLALGLDLDNIQADRLPRPAKTLDDIYKLAGLRYEKRRYQVEDTIYRLDLERMCFECSNVLPRLQLFINAIEGAFQPVH